MARDIAQIARQEIEAHRQFKIGVTTTDPDWKDVDAIGNKGWVIDVHLGPYVDDPDGVEENVLVDVPISQVARAVVGQKNIPVLMERSKQMGWTVVGRSHVLPAGYAIGTILEETYHRFQYNYRSLLMLHVADLDYTLETFDEAVARWNGGDTSRMQIVRAWDAFGHQVEGPEVTNPPQEIQDKLSSAPLKTGTARHLVVHAETFDEAVARWNGGDTSAMQTTLRTMTSAAA